MAKLTYPLILHNSNKEVQVNSITLTVNGYLEVKGMVKGCNPEQKEFVPFDEYIDLSEFYPEVE